MRWAEQLTHSRYGMRSGRRARRAASRLVFALSVSVSCQAENIVRPRSDIALSRNGSGMEATTRTQHVETNSLVDGHSIRGSNAVLKRRSDGLSVQVRTRELAPDETVDVFWAIFNNPEACTHPNPSTGAPCSPPDLLGEGTQASLHFLATLTADAHGRLRYSASLATGSKTGCIGDPFPCHTLTDPFDAEVHSAMMVPNEGRGRQAAQFVPR